MLHIIMVCIPPTVGADPHFIIDVPYGNLTICFDLQADAGTLINLLSDPVLGRLAERLTLLNLKVVIHCSN